MILFHQFLAKWKKERKKKKHHIKNSLLFWRLQNPSVSRMCKQSHSNWREILTLLLVNPWASVLSFVVVWVWPTSSGQGVKRRLGCIKSAWSGLPSRHFLYGMQDLHMRRRPAQHGYPRRDRAQGREEIGGRAAMRVTIWGIPDKASQIRTPLHWSLHFSGSGYPLLCSEKSQLDGL